MITNLSSNNIEDIQEILDIQLAVESLLERGNITKQDIELLEKYLEGYSYREMSKMLIMDRRFISRRVKRLCGLIFKELKHEY